MGRKPKELTTKQISEVETLAAVLSQEQIADYFGIARNTFTAMMDRDPSILEQYKKGKARAIKEIGGGLIQEARGGNLTAAMFYLKTQAGWREKDKIEDNGDSPSVPVTFTVAAPVKDVKVTVGK